MKINIKNIKVKSICATLFISLFLSCGSGAVAEETPQSKFLKSLADLGDEFLNVFTSFGDSIGNALGFSAVTSDNKRNIVGKHFDKVKTGLENTKNQLSILSDKISKTKNADTKDVEDVTVTIKKAIDEVISKLIDSLTKLTEVTNAEIDIAEGAAAGANEDSVKSVIKNVKKIVDVANEVEKNLGINIIQKGNNGNPVANGEGPRALISNAQAIQGDGSKLAKAVSDADPWAMIDKINNTTSTTPAVPVASSEAGVLATATASNANAGAKTTADLAAAVALKAMTKDGKFSQAQSNEVGAVKAAAASAVNKLLGILDLIIIKTVVSNLEK